MFTTEFDHDEILITVLDDHANYQDLSIYIYDDIVCLKQWDEDIQTWNTIYISPQMFEEFMEAMNMPEGAYIMRTK